MTYLITIFRRMVPSGIQLRAVLLFTFALFIVAISGAFFALSVGKPHMGITLSLKDGGWMVESVDTNGLARRAGIGKGNLPVEVNGEPAVRFLETYRGNGVVFGWVFNELSVMDDRGQLKSVTLSGNSPSWQSVVERVAWFAVSLIFWVVGFFCPMKRPRNRAALLLCLSGLVFGLVVAGNMATATAVPAAYELQIAASIFGPWVLLHFFLVLPAERTRARENPLVYLIYLPAAITLILFFLIGYADGQPVQWFRTVRLFGYGAGFVATTGVAVLSYFHAASIRTRQQMRIVLISCLAALIPLLILYLFPSAIWSRNILPPEFAILLIGFIPLGMGFAVVTQRLMDIDIIIRRTVIYGLVTVIMTAVLAVAIFFVLALPKPLGVPRGILVALVLGGIATFLFGPTKKGINTLIDRLFYKDRYDYRQIVSSLSVSLRSCQDFIDVSRLVVGVCTQTLNLAGGCLFIKTQSGSFEIGASQGTFAQRGKQEELKTMISQRHTRIEFPNSASTADPDVAFLVPLTAGEKEFGVLCLSGKASKQEFSADDTFLLQGVGSVATMGLRSAALVRDVSMRDTFVSIASHELRNPLTAIVGYAELLQRRDPPEATRKKWVKQIVDNGRRLAVMADDLLNVSRIQSGKLIPKLEKVRLCDVLQEKLSEIRESTSKHKFIVDIAPSLPCAIVDREKFGQVIMNLLSNAVKYSPDGGHVTLSAQSDPSNNRVIVSVRDEGIGIGPEDKDSLFTTFHRIQRPETQHIKGSGLGLYIVKEWTEAMGGKVWLESELNKGSTFFVAVPTQASGNSD